MKNCVYCGAQMDDTANICGNCKGQQPIQQYQQNQYQQYAPPVYVDLSDHTGEMDPDDIAENKLIASMCYIFGLIGIVIAAIIAKESRFVRFHIKQGIKIAILNALVLIITAVLSITIIVAIAGFVCLVILLVVDIICFFNTISGKAKEPPIVKGFGFLK